LGKIERQGKVYRGRTGREKGSLFGEIKRKRDE